MFVLANIGKKTGSLRCITFSGWIWFNIDKPNSNYFYFHCCSFVPLPFGKCTSNPLSFDIALWKKFAKELNLSNANRMQVPFDFQKLYVIEFQNQTVFRCFSDLKNWYPERFFWNFKFGSFQCLVSTFDIKLRYRWPIRFEKVKKKTFSFDLFINQFDFHYQDCFFFKWSYKTNSLTVFFKEVFFLKIFSSWRKILTTLYLIFCCHHFPKTHPSFWIAQQWIVKGSKKSICRDLLGINRVKNI